MSLLLIHPPVVKPCEPPAGLAKLAGALSHNGISHHILDANLEGILSLLESDVEGNDTWTRKAQKNLARNLALIRGPELYGNFQSYKRIIRDVNHLLQVSASGDSIKLSFADYQDRYRSPVRSADLLHAAEHPGINPFYTYFKKRLVPLLESQGHTIAGFSLNYLSQALTTFAMAGFIKRHFPSMKIVFGGGLVTSWTKSPSWRNPFSGLVDHLVAGPGEIPLLAILAKKADETIFYRPQFHQFPVNSYMAPGFIMPYSTSTGCYWGKCSFCPETAEGNQYVQIPTGEAIAEITSIAAETKPALIHLVDNAVSPALLKAIAANPPGAPWYGFVRVTEHLADPDFCRALKDSGCAMLKLGVESGDQGVLDAMNKGIRISLVSQALKALTKAGIATYAYLLFGTPYETERQARTTLNFVAEHSQYITFLNVAIFNLPLNSPEAQGLELKDFYEGDLSLYTDFIHPKGWSRRKVRSFLDKEFKKDPAIQQIIQRQPPFFTSNHAPFFAIQNE